MFKYCPNELFFFFFPINSTAVKGMRSKGQHSSHVRQEIFLLLEFGGLLPCSYSLLRSTLVLTCSSKPVYSCPKGSDKTAGSANDEPLCFLKRDEIEWLRVDQQALGARWLPSEAGPLSASHCMLTASPTFSDVAVQPVLSN